MRKEDNTKRAEGKPLCFVVGLTGPLCGQSITGLLIFYALVSGKSI